MIRPFLQRASILALAASLIVPAALAQTPQPQPEQQAPQVDPSEDELEDTAELLVDIEDVQREYQERLRATENPEDAQAIEQEMREEIDQTIEDFEGLSAERYDEIIRAAQADVELKEKIVALLEETREERGNQGG